MIPSTWIGWIEAPLSEQEKLESLGIKLGDRKYSHWDECVVKEEGLSYLRSPAFKGGYHLTPVSSGDNYHKEADHDV